MSEFFSSVIFLFSFLGCSKDVFFGLSIASRFLGTVLIKKSCFEPSGRVQSFEPSFFSPFFFFLFFCPFLFVAACPIWSYAHTCIQLSAMQQQCSSQRVGALLIHRPVCVDQHTHTHRCPKGMAVFGPCDQTAQQYSAETPQTW